MLHFGYLLGLAQTVVNGMACNAKAVQACHQLRLGNTAAYAALGGLDLSNNGFNSLMPSWLFNLTGLVYVDLSSNNFWGELPDEFADMKFIQHIDLAENSFIEGKLSTRLGKLCNLRVLDLSFKQISGEMIEYTVALSKCSSCSIELLHLGYNKLDT
ncbi:hypothetical protein Ddye_000061 [Dipteronia dyeriana]|uniref:Toll-like receptor 5 n=1 Tax=Dipteronia dyeriana TaxID=168575 RepID=A0AAD9XLM9_9ROSI|nr:hypothetical protein Ddye_000061 [Dipteronia dyeriana]